MKEPLKIRNKIKIKEAIIWDGTNFEYVKKFCPNIEKSKRTVIYKKRVVQVLAIKTLEGVMECTPGNWIIKGIKGEFYPCDDEVFHDSYQICGMRKLMEGHDEFTLIVDEYKQEIEKHKKLENKDE